MINNEVPKDFLFRHGDKGCWRVNKTELKRDKDLSADEVRLIFEVLENEFNNPKETPLEKSGLIRSVKLGEKLFAKIVNHPDFQRADNKALVIAIDSGKDRTRLTRALATNRIAQLEGMHNNKKDKSKNNQIQIDILHLEADEIARMMDLADESTWGPYKEMMGNEDITEDEAVIRWLNDMNLDTNTTDSSIHPRESAKRYREIMCKMRERVKAKNIPMFIVGGGHSGPLGQIKREKIGRSLDMEDVPTFCEIYGFNEQGNLILNERVDIKP